MKEEIAAAVVFLSRFMKNNNIKAKEKTDEFSSCLSALLRDRFQNHWYQDEPYKGQGYRCIRINSAEPVDPVLEKAAADSGIQYSDLNMPHELTLWVDPDEVCCRFGEHEGSLCVLASFKNGSILEENESVDIDEIMISRKEKDQLNQQVNILTAGKEKQPSVDDLPKPVPVGKQNFETPQFQHNYNWNQQSQNQAGGRNTPVGPKNQQKSNKTNQKLNNSFSVNANNNRNSTMPKVSPKNRNDRFHWVRSNGNKL